MMNRLPSVAVLMSTYNGEKYLLEQVESISKQRGVSVSIFIRDDCSSDGTKKILNKVKKDYGAHVILDTNNIGPANSFMQLLYATSGYDYYAFADQDDIWLDDKLITAINKISSFECPSLYCSNQIVFDDSGNKYNRYNNRPNLDPISVIFSNSIAGCTMVFNHQLSEILKDKDNRPRPNVLSLRMHDTWTVLVALLCGKVVYDEKGHILYRIHDNNAVGVRMDNSSVYKRIKSAFGNNGIIKSLNYRQLYASEILRCNFQLRDEDKGKLQLISNYKNSIADKLKLLHNRSIYKSSGENIIGYKMKIIFNIL